MTYHHRNHNIALTNEEIYRYAPSVFATQAHDSRTERFRPIPTIQIVESLRKEGFEVVSATQSNTRDSSKRDFTKHLLRLRHVNDLSNVTAREKINDTHGEIILKNGNDGSSSYQLHAGAWREVCSNGLVAMTDLFDCIRVKHMGDMQRVASNVIEGTFTVLRETDSILAARDTWSQIQMSDEARIAFAEAAHVVRFGDGDGKVETPIKPRQLLITRRSYDTKTDLFTVYNVVQENAIKGGLRAYNQKTGRRTTTKEINNLDNDVKINKALWKIADYFSKQVKSAA